MTDIKYKVRPYNHAGSKTKEMPCRVQNAGTVMLDFRLFRVGTFGNAKICSQPKFGKKYILFLKSSTRSANGIPFHPNRYNPVISSPRNIKFFTNVVAGES